MSHSLRWCLRTFLWARPCGDLLNKHRAPIKASQYFPLKTCRENRRTWNFRVDRRRVGKKFMALNRLLTINMRKARLKIHTEVFHLASCKTRHLIRRYKCKNSFSLRLTSTSSSCVLLIEAHVDARGFCLIIDNVLPALGLPALFSFFFRFLDQLPTFTRRGFVA